MSLHLFTLVFIVLKVMGYIHWSWLLVFLPSILAFVIPFLVILVGGFTAYKPKDL